MIIKIGRAFTFLSGRSIYNASFKMLYSQNLKNKSPIPIESLSQLLRSKQMLEIPNFEKQQFDPCDLFMSVVKAIKQNLYQTPEYGQKIIKAINKYKQNFQYMKIFVNILLPADKLFADLNKIYVQIAISYLKLQTQFQKQELFYVLDNLERMLVQMKSQWTDQNWILRDYSKQQQLATLLTPKLLEKENQFDMPFFLKLTKICDTLSVNNPTLAAFLTKQILSTTCRIKMKDILYILIYLSKFDFFPYEYFYMNKQKWIKTIESYNKYSTKKSFETIKMFQIMLMQNPMHCEKLIRRLEDLLLQATPSFDNQQLAHIWFLTSRARFGISTNLIKILLQKMSMSVNDMATKQLCLLARGFSRFRRMDDFKQICESILKVIQKNLDTIRTYEHEIIREVMREQIGSTNQVKVMI